MPNVSADFYATQLERDGYIVIKDFFLESDVAAACDEVMRLYDVDFRLRNEQGIRDAIFKGSDVTSVLTTPTHLLLNIYGKSPKLDQLFEKILTDSVSSSLLEKLGGKSWKLRGYNSQKLTGAIDSAPTVGVSPNPHEWHRDSPGEICISIFLTDLQERNMGATSLVKGSHVYPYCPRWNCLLGPPHRLKRGMQSVGNFFVRLNVFSRIVGYFVNRKSTGAYGKRGDFYIFLNDTWHGREPNISGKPGIKFMVGAFPSSMPFPDVVEPPSEDVLVKLPPQLRLAASQTAPMVDAADTIIQRTLSKQQHFSSPILRLAQIERLSIDWALDRAIDFFKKT